MSVGTQQSSSSSSSESESWSQSLSEYFSNTFSQNTSDSQNTSASQNTSSSQNSSKSGTSESRLSTLQADNLQDRMEKANSYFFPELQAAIDETKGGSEANNAVMEQNANAVNTAYDASQKATEQTLAQQGLNGKGSGVEAALKAANNRARSSSLAQAYFNQLSASQNNKATLLNTMASLMPSTTNSAEYYSNSESQGTSTSQGTSASQGTSTSQGTNTSESKGSSSSASEASANSVSSGSSSGWHASVR